MFKKVSIALCLVYFKSTILLNITSSVFFAFMIKKFFETLFNSNISFFYTYLYCLTYGGPLFTFYYKEVTYKNEYYFYHNKGIKKEVLMAFAALLYILIGNLILLIATYFT